MHVVIQVYREVLTFLASHLIVTIAGCILLGFGLGITTYGTIQYRRERRIRRWMSFFQSSLIETLEVTTLASSIRLHQHIGGRGPHIVNTQAPGIQPHTYTGGSTIQTSDSILEYYFPQNTPGSLEMGIRASRWVDLIFGKPAVYCIPLLLEPVLVDAAGKWYPAIIQKESGLTVLRQTLRRRIKNNFWRLDYRNLYVCDFVVIGEVLGVIDLGGKIEVNPIVRAPVTGFVLTFEALTYTDVVPNANVMFIGRPKQVKTIPFEGDRAGRFAIPEHVQPPLGTIQRAGAVLCTVTSLGIAQEVHMPMDGLIVRQYKKTNDPVVYRDADLQCEKLFDYIPLEQPLT